MNAPRCQQQYQLDHKQPRLHHFNQPEQMMRPLTTSFCMDISFASRSRISQIWPNLPHSSSVVQPRAITAAALGLVLHGLPQLVDALPWRDVDFVVLTRSVDCAAVRARHLAAYQRHRAPVLGHSAGYVDLCVCGRVCLREWIWKMGRVVCDEMSGKRGQETYLAEHPGGRRCLSSVRRLLGNCRVDILD
jgi:hypothetical protein